MEIDALPPDVRELVLGEVRKDEKVIWAEQPDPIRFMLSGIPPMPVGILFTAYPAYLVPGSATLFHNALGGLKDNPDLSFFLGIGLLGILFGIAMFLFGLYLLAFPYLKKQSALKTAYILTNKRAICFNKIGVLQLNNPSKGYEILSYAPDKLINMRKVVRGNGSGDLIFVEVPIRIPGPDLFMQFRKVGYLSLKDVNSVEDLLRKTLLGNRDGSVFQ